MVTIDSSETFFSIYSKIKSSFEKERVDKQIKKIILNPEIGEPMRHSRNGTREVYIGSFRLSYAYLKEEDKIILLDLYHKNKQ